MHFNFRVRVGFKAFDHDPVAGAQSGQQRFHGWLFGSTQLMHDGEPLPAGQNDFPGAGFPVLMAVRAGLVHIHPMMGMLDGIHRQAPARQFANQRAGEGGFAAVFPADYSNDIYLASNVHCRCCSAQARSSGVLMLKKSSGPNSTRDSPWAWVH